MDTTRKNSVSTITGFIQSEDETGTISPSEEGSPRHRVQMPPRHSVRPEQMYPPPAPNYYPYYPPPPPLTMAPSMSCFYIELLKHLSMQNELHNYLPMFENKTNEKKLKDIESKVSNKHEIQKECDSRRNDEPPRPFSRLCVSCEQLARCSCCSKPLSPDRGAVNDNSDLQRSCCQWLPLHSFTHLHPSQVLPCGCTCPKHTEVKPKQKSRQKSKKIKCNQICLQPEKKEVPERDNPYKPTKNRSKPSSRTYCKEQSQESSDSDEIYQPGQNRECYEAEYKSEEDKRYGTYGGEGDENRAESSAHKSQLLKKPIKLRKTRRSLAYFINV